MSTVLPPLLLPPELLPPELPPLLLLLLLPQAARASTAPAITHPLIALPRYRIRLLCCRCRALGCPIRQRSRGSRRRQDVERPRRRSLTEPQSPRPRQGLRCGRAAGERRRLSRRRARQ